MLWTHPRSVKEDGGIYGDGVNVAARKTVTQLKSQENAAIFPAITRDLSKILEKFLASLK